MAERAAGRARRFPAGREARGAAGAASRSAAARRRRGLPRWGAIAGAAVGLAVLGYGCFWLDLPLRRTLAETVLTSQHFQWARLLGTPAELRAWQNQWLHTPDVQVVTTTVPTHPAAPVTVTPISGPAYRGWLLTVPDPARIVLGTSRYLGSYGERPSLMAAREGATAAVNGGGFMDPGGQGYGGAPIGVTMSEGRVVPADPDDGSDYVIGFDLHDRLVAGKWTIAESQSLGIRDAVSFKPLLIADGRPMITQGDGGWGVGPRTAIGQEADGTVLFLVIDGRQPGSLGATLRETQDVLLAAGAVTAANLDGGSSTLLWKDGQVLNHPSSPYGERPVPTAFLVMPAGFNADREARPNLSAQAQVPAVAGPIAPPQPTPGPCSPGADEGGGPAASSGAATPVGDAHRPASAADSSVSSSGTGGSPARERTSAIGPASSPTSGGTSVVKGVAGGPGAPATSVTKSTAVSGAASTSSRGTPVAGAAGTGPAGTGSGIRGTGTADHPPAAETLCAPVPSVSRASTAPAGGSGSATSTSGAGTRADRASP